MKNNIKNICLFVILASTTFCLKLCMATLPNIEPVTLTLTLYTLLFGWQSVFIVMVYIFLEIAFYGFSLWSIGYLYIWLVLVVVTKLIMNISDCNVKLIALWNGLFGFMFGALYIPLYIITSDLGNVITWWVAGIPYDLIHGISNLIISILILPKLYNTLKIYANNS